MKEHFTLQSDVYRKRRGNYARLLDICCRECKGSIAVYQKDGAGTLRRLYLDRILFPLSLGQSRKRRNGLQCKKCHEILGTLFLYKKEKRRAFRLYQDAVITKIKKVSEGRTLSTLHKP